MLCRVRASLLAHARLCGAAPFSTTPGSREDWERFRQDGKKVVDFIADYYRDLPSLPVKSEVAPGYLKVRPCDGGREWVPVWAARGLRSA